MTLRRVAIVVVLVLVAAGLAFTLRRAEEPAPASRQFEFTYVTRLPELPTGGEEIRLWIPLPRRDGYQEITALSVDAPVRVEQRREPVFGNRYLYLETAPAQLPEPLEIRVTFEVTRQEHLVALGAGNGAVRAAEKPPAELAAYLEPDRLVPTDGIIAQLARQETRGLTDPLEKARAIYDYVVSTLRYDKSGEGWGRGDAIYACNAKQGNCTDFHALFIGMMRAAGIPARFEIGFPLPPDQRKGNIGGYHCWAQFYVEPYGWIPVDASEAWKHPDKRAYFFGAHDEHRVLFTFGRDIWLEPPQAGEPLNYFIYPHAELDGEPLSLVESSFSFRDLGAPREPARAALVD